MAYGDGMVRFEVDEITLRDIERRLGLMRVKAPSVLSRALNDTARQARKDLATKAQEAYALKIGGFARYVRIIGARNANLEAILQVRGSALPLAQKYFSVRGGKGPHGSPLKTTVLKGKTHTWGPRAFNNKLSKGETVHKGAAEFVGGHRKQPSRLHIKTLYTTSIPQMIGSERHVYGIVEPNINSNLRANVEHHIAVMLRG